MKAMSRTYLPKIQPIRGHLTTRQLLKSKVSGFSKMMRVVNASSEWGVVSVVSGVGEWVVWVSGEWAVCTLLVRVVWVWGAWVGGIRGVGSVVVV